MWLLNAETLVLEHFQDGRQVEGQYAILSHTWGDDEVSFDEIHLDSAKSKQGYRKIANTCRQAVADGLKYAWVDTCCIDKRSSSELSEAINSMYRWYYHARVCYAYLSDLPPPYTALNCERLQNCHWFTRGWTLQELIAPPLLVFYYSDWTMLASRTDIAEVLADITHIDQDVLVDREQLWQTSVAKRMSWASMRTTTREEDLAYSLLGIFDINMPLLYGEGPKAFIRLQEEIIRTWTQVDHSILTWDGESEGLLALSPAQFPVHFPMSKFQIYRNDIKRNIISWRSLQNETFELSNQGLRITLYARAVGRTLAEEIEKWQPKQDGPRHLDLGAEESERLLVALNCTYSSSKDMLFAMYLRRRPWINHYRYRPTSINHHDYAMYDYEPQHTAVPVAQLNSFTMTTLVISRTSFKWPPNSAMSINWESASYSITTTHPVEAWTKYSKKLFLNLNKIPPCHEDSASLVIGSVGLDSSMLTLYVQPQKDGQIPILRVGLQTPGSLPDIRWKTIENGERHIFDVDGHAEIAIVAETFFIANTMIWALTVGDHFPTISGPHCDQSKSINA
jgi:hypothetical protein